MQAVVKIGSSQYLVSKDQELLVDRPEIDQILLIIDQEKVYVGQPVVSGANVKLRVLNTEKGKKVRSAIYKAKSRYRKTRGFRPTYSRILIEEVSFKKEKTRETKS